MSNGSSRNSTAPEGRLVEHHCYPVPDLFLENLCTAGPYIVISTLNALLAIFATAGNILVFVAVRRVTSIRVPSKLLLCSLLMTDIGIGVVVQPQYAAVYALKASRDIRQNCLLLRCLYLTTPMLSCASLLIMMAISLDRYFALSFRHRYHKTVTARRVLAALVFIWSFSAFYASLRFWSESAFNLITVAASFPCFLVISVSYIKIYRGLRRQERRRLQFAVHGPLLSANQPLNAATPYRRLASTMIRIYLVFIACYSPYFWARLVALLVRNNPLIFVIREFLYTLVLCNSTLNPLVYFFFLRDLRAEVRKQLLCCGQNVNLK